MVILIFSSTISTVRLCSNFPADSRCLYSPYFANAKWRRHTQVLWMVPAATAQPTTLIKYFRPRTLSEETQTNPNNVASTCQGYWESWISPVALSVLPRFVISRSPVRLRRVAPVFSINRFGFSGTLFHLTTPCARRSAKSAVVNPRPPSTSSVCWPMAGASWWMLVGVLDRWIQGASNVVRPAVG